MKISKWVVLLVGLALLNNVGVSMAQKCKGAKLGEKCDPTPTPTKKTTPPSIISKTCSIVVRVRQNNQPLSGVQLRMTGAKTQEAEINEPEGVYIFRNLICGGSYTITPKLAGFSFDPPSKQFIVRGDIFEFSATPARAPSPTPAPACLKSDKPMPEVLQVGTNFEIKGAINPASSACERNTNLYFNEYSWTALYAGLEVSAELDKIAIGSLSLEVFDAQGAPADVRYGEGNNPAKFTLSTVGTYLIRLRSRNPFSDLQPAPYELTWKITGITETGYNRSLESLLPSSLLSADASLHTRLYHAITAASQLETLRAGLQTLHQYAPQRPATYELRSLDLLYAQHQPELAKEHMVKAIERGGKGWLRVEFDGKGTSKFNKRKGAYNNQEEGWLRFAPNGVELLPDNQTDPIALDPNKLPAVITGEFETKAINGKGTLKWMRFSDKALTDPQTLYTWLKELTTKPR